MNITERDRLASALIALRPDWGQGAVDKVKRVRTWLSENAMEWSYLDALVRMTVCAIDTSTVTPARALTDGLWTKIARQLTADGAAQPGTADGPECGICGVRKPRHRGAATMSADIGEHAFVLAPTIAPSDPAFIARVRPEFHRTEEQA